MTQLYLHSEVHGKYASPHLQLEQFPLQTHWISSLQDLETSGMVIQVGVQELFSFVQAKCAGGGNSCRLRSLVDHIPA